MLYFALLICIWKVPINYVYQIDLVEQFASEMCWSCTFVQYLSTSYYKNALLWKIKAHIMVMNYETQACFKSLQTDFHAQMK